MVENVNAKNLPSTDVYLVRHGQTEANVQGWMSGWSETDLTEVGIAQARAAGEALADSSIRKVISSDLSRAHRTAELVSQGALGGKVALVPELREWHFGRFERASEKEMWAPVFGELGVPVTQSYLAAATFWDNMDLLRSRGLGEADLMNALAALDPSGEASNWEQYMSRVHSAIDQITLGAQHAAQNSGALVAVTHGAITRTLLPTMDPSGYDGQGIGNASISHLSYREGVFKILRVGVDPHDW